MSVTPATWIVAVTGLTLIALVGSLQAVAVVRPRAEWTIRNVYGGRPQGADDSAYFAHNVGFAWADTFFWVPLQVGASVGMLLGRRWGFLLGLVASVPFWYTSILFYVWDRDMGFRQNSVTYWVVVWGMWPVFGVIEGAYTFVRLLE